MGQDIGFVGLGAMGLPMAAGLAGAGHRLRVYDIDPAARERAAAVTGIAAVPDLPAAAAGAEVLFTCLPNDAILREAYLGPAGIAGALAKGATTIDCSTVSPKATQEISAALRDRGVAHLDAAMLGSVPQAETGEIGFVVGGERQAFEAAAPLLDVLGRFRVYAGGSGAANRIKLIHQSLVAANAVAVAEALALCRATDTDLDCFYDVVCNGGGFAYSRYFEKRLPRMRTGDFSPLFMLQLMKKDAALGRDLASEAGLVTPLLDQVVQRFEAALAQGLGAEDFSAVARLYDREGEEA
ncbi:MAG: NAD(P)-dependent oxidoreductase [Kiloniellales bacterium]|nr:NAD(P)-dependent oxidoreductase [Kiloniellales bacterium]